MSRHSKSDHYIPIHSKYLVTLHLLIDRWSKWRLRVKSRRGPFTFFLFFEKIKNRGDRDKQKLIIQDLTPF